MLGVAQRRRLGVGFVRELANVGMFENVEALSISGHQAVLDAVVNHLYEVTAAGWTAMQIAFFGGSAGFFAAGGAVDVAASGSQRFENGIEVLHDVGFAADHLTISSLKSPDSPARAHIHVVNASRRKLLGAPNVIDVVGVAPIDDDVPDVEL